MSRKQHGKRATRRAPTPARDWPPGFFTEPVRAWKCLQWAGPLTMAADGGGAERFTDLAKRGRRKANADGSGIGPMVLPGTRKQTAPAWMPRPRTA